MKRWLALVVLGVSLLVLIALTLTFGLWWPGFKIFLTEIGDFIQSIDSAISVAKDVFVLLASAMGILIKTRRDVEKKATSSEEGDTDTRVEPGYSSYEVPIIIPQVAKEALDSLLGMLDEGVPDLHVDAQDALHVTLDRREPLVLSREIAERVGYAAARKQDMRAYLVGRIVDPEIGLWAERFVPLEMGLRAAPRRRVGVGCDASYRMWEDPGQGAQRQPSTPLADISEATSKHDRIVLLGQPGSGKTTTLRKALLDTALARLRTGQGRIPLFLPLSEYYPTYAAPRDFIASQWERWVGTGEEDLKAHLERGELLLLCDALNEMPVADGMDPGKRVGAWCDLAGECLGNQIIVSCRRRDYQQAFPTWPQVEIDPLTLQGVQDFLTRYLPDRADATWDRLQNSPLMALVRNPLYLHILVYGLQDPEGEWPANAAQLFARFVRMRLGREVWKKHSDWDKAQVIQETLPVQQALTALAESLQPLGAGTAHSRAEIESRIPHEVVVTEDGDKGLVKELAPDAVVEVALASLMLTTVGERDDQTETLKFYHHQLQEYFAARGLVARFEKGERLVKRWRIPRISRERRKPDSDDVAPLAAPPTTGWEEPTILAAGLVDDPSSFVDAVRVVNPVLAARCLDEVPLDLPEVRGRVQADLQRELESRRRHVRLRIAAGEALGTLGDPRFEAITVEDRRVVLPPLVRVPAGSFRMGSSRAHVRRLKRQGFDYASDEIPSRVLSLPEFYIGRYPVTNAEYDCFVAAGGYKDEAYWRTEAARAWLRGQYVSDELVEEWVSRWQGLQDDLEGALERYRRRGDTSQQLRATRGLAALSETEFRKLVTDSLHRENSQQAGFRDDTRFNSMTQPVVGVTWFEARAYCAWLTEQLSVQANADGFHVFGRRGVSLLSLSGTTWCVRLPSEAEWERAARGGRRYTYPWGVRWYVGRANTNESRILRTTPVGAFPRGVNALGVHDVAGNVWEWTRSLYRDYTLEDDEGREDLDVDGRRVVRGGSWSFDRRNARCASRFRYDPGLFGNYIGFRVVVSLVDPDC